MARNASFPSHFFCPTHVHPNSAYESPSITFLITSIIAVLGGILSGLAVKYELVSCAAATQPPVTAATQPNDANRRFSMVPVSGRRVSFVPMSGRRASVVEVWEPISEENEGDAISSDAIPRTVAFK